MRGRYEIAGFARRMLFTLGLPRNKQKPGWLDCSLEQLEAKLDEEYQELKHELKRFHGAMDSSITEEHEILFRRRRIADEATDLGCVSMMITDMVGGLDER